MISENRQHFQENVLRQSWIEIDLDAIAQNVENIKKFIGNINYTAVVKANAYGLGVIPVVKTILEHGADRLALVSLEECLELRNAGINSPLFNMGPIFPNQAKIVVENNIEQMAYRLEEIKSLSEIAASLNTVAKIHFKINTGMNRYGVNYQEALQAFEEFHDLPHIKIIGVMTHFPMSDELDKSFALLQIERFNALKTSFENSGYNIPFWHMGNSGAVLDLPDAHFNLVRVGLMNYGYWPSSQVRRPFALVPAMHVKSKIVEIRIVQRGDTVGYGRRFLAEKKERIGVLPIGYADGYDRKIRVGGYVLINGQRVPIVSGLCMDALFLKLSDFADVKIGDTATIMGINNGQEISPHDIARLTDTVSYEIISSFGRRLPRVYIKNGEISEIDNPLLC